MDEGWRKKQREWAHGNETTKPEDKLHFYKRAGSLEEGVRGLSDDELISLFRSWGIELARGNFAYPEMFFVEELFDHERFDIWAFVQDRFPLRLQTEADLRWFNALPDEAKTRIEDANIRRPEELLNPILHLDLLQNFENVILPRITFISEISSSPFSKETSFIEGFSKLDSHILSSHKRPTRFESFSSLDLFKKPTRAEIVRRFLKSIPNVLETLQPSVRERIMEVISA